MSKKRYPIRIPRFATGIRLQESRSSSYRNWWAKKWMNKLDLMGLGTRLGRGRNYAISGQVVKLKTSLSHVEASVLGVRPDPYSVTLDFRTPDAKGHARIVSAIRAEPMLLARLLVNDLPMEVELLFDREGCALFPGGRLSPGKYDITMSCSCPDYAKACKHSAAVLIVLGEEVARRPFALLEFRGFEMEEFFDEA